MERDPELGDKWATAKMQNLLPEEDKDLVTEEALEETKMPRPCKIRRVRGRPSSSYFKPAGIRIADLEESVLTMPEFEATRLVDLNEVPQEEAGKQMQISQSTLSRVLKSGRKKIADAIVNGKAIKIET